MVGVDIRGKCSFDHGGGELNEFLGIISWSNDGHMMQSKDSHNQCTCMA